MFTKRPSPIVVCFERGKTTSNQRCQLDPGHHGNKPPGTPSLHKSGLVGSVGQVGRITMGQAIFAKGSICLIKFATFVNGIVSDGGAVQYMSQSAIVSIKR